MISPGLGTLITFNPASIGADMTVGEVAARLVHSSFHHWPVIDEEHRVVGIISDSNLIKVLGELQAVGVSAVMEPRPCIDVLQTPVRQVMSSNVKTITQHATARQALQILLESKIHSLPVVEDERLIGIVTSTDFLRELSYGESGLARTPVSRHMTKSDEAIEAHASLDEAREVMLIADVEYLPVIKGDCPLAVLSRRSLRTAKCAELVRLAGSTSEGYPVNTVWGMAKSAPTIKPGAKLSAAAGLMVDHGVRAVAVVNQTNRLLGLISEDAILQAVNTAMEKG